MIYGGLPQVLQFSVERQKAEYLKNIFTNVYIKDVVERNKLRNVDEIDTLVDILASAIGAPTNPTKISNTFKSERGINYSNKTISNHIDYLVEAFLISKADRYDIKGRKYVGANLKYYFSDVGLRNARLNFRQQEPTHIMENIVYNELLIRGYNVDVGIVEAYAKNDEGKTNRNYPMAFFSCCQDKSPMQCWRVITLPLLNCWVCTTLNSAGFVRLHCANSG